jgi:hypothetical protein
MSDVPQYPPDYPPGTIVDEATAKRLQRQGVPVRFGVVLAPPPSERVQNICADDPAVWRPAVAEAIAEAYPWPDEKIAGPAPAIYPKRRRP